MKIIKKCKTEAQRGLRRMVTGRGISSEFFRKNFFATGLILIFCVGFIAIRFDCVTSMERIKSLDHQIKVMCTYKQRERSRYTTLTREITIKHTVGSLGLGLGIPEQYPLSLTYED